VTLAHVDVGDLLPRYAAAGVDSVRVRAYGIDRSRPLRAIADVALSLVRALATRPDVLYINQYHDALFAAAVARLLRVPLVCHLRLFPPQEFCGQWRIGLRAVSRFIAVSEATRRAYVERGFDAAAIELVVNGVDIERFHPMPDRAAIRRNLGLDPDAFTILYVGRVDRMKNIDGLLRSFAELRAAVPKARLLVAGRPLVHSSAEEGQRYLDTLKSLADSLGVAAAVRWLGPRTDVVELNNAADACALLSREPETFGRTLAEAMACGTPPVGAAIGGIPEVMVGDAAGFVVPPNDDRAAARVFRELADWHTRDPELGARLRKVAVERFDAKRMVREVAVILERTVAEGAVRRGPRDLQG
jgi:glycosyltransferase involved in cell wall biosynthesis